MTNQNNLQLHVGDWVKAKSKNGELVHGFIEAVDHLQGGAKVYVVASDLEATVGRTIELLSATVEKYPVSTIETEEQTHDLIDLALLTRDESWFQELFAKQQTMRQRAGSDEKQRAPLHATRSRLRASDLLS